jgi:hypothetical protein
MPRVYVYVVDRDFGFAPNPFHGYCTLATCKPGIRAQAHVGDWVIGMGGARLEATGRCIFAMRVTERLSFDEYWSQPRHLDKRPVRNGSRTMMVGDNIYHRETATNHWRQADSHHSNADGSPNLHNLRTDTKSDRVLLSRHFFYFGSKAPTVPAHLLDALGYRNGRNYRVFDFASAAPVIAWLHDSFAGSLNLVAADPFDFASSEKRYSVSNNKIT